MSIQEIIDRYSHLTDDRLRLWHSTALDTPDAIILVVAPWSGQAIAAVRMLTSLLSREFPDSAVPVLVCDIDELSNDLRRMLDCPIRGNGETMWIRNGTRVALMDNYRADDWAEQVRQNMTLLESPQGTT